MSAALLDVNVLVALLDRSHVHHASARAWLTAQTDPSWATCAITQNGLVRILSQPSYANPISVEAGCQLLEQACATQHHEFWSCDHSLLDSRADNRPVLRSRQLTDVYLLGLAVKHDGRLVTFDRSIPLGAVTGATHAHLVVL